MKIIAINGSPKGKKSQTYVMVEEFLKGTRECGWTDRHILLSEMDIHHCMGCFHCWKTKGNCIFDDDMKNLRTLESDILILATPLYLDNVSGLLKNFLDRFVAGANPLMVKDVNNKSVHVVRDMPRPKLVAISNRGFPEQTHFDVLKLFFRRMARNWGSELIGEIYRGEGPFLTRKDHELKSIIDEYKLLLRTAGREIAENFSLSEETKSKLEEPLIPYDDYLQKHSAIFSEV